MGEFIKVHGDNAVAGWDRATRLFEAAGTQAGFSAPRPLRHLPEKGAIAYEVLPPGLRLGQVLSRRALHPIPDKGDIHAALRATGAALAGLHERMRPGEGTGLPLASFLTDTAPRLRARAEAIFAAAPVAALHGDFGHGNVWIARDGNIWIYDSQPSVFCPDPEAVRAAIYYDAAHMVSCLWGLYPLALQPFLGRLPRRVWIEAFLKGYEDRAGFALDRATVLLLAAGILDRYASHFTAARRFPKDRWWRRALTRQHDHLLHAAMEACDRDQLS